MDLKSKTIHLYILPLFYGVLLIAISSQLKEPTSAIVIVTSTLTTIGAFWAAYIANQNHKLVKQEKLDEKIRLVGKLSRESFTVYFSILSYANWYDVSSQMIQILNSFCDKLEEYEHLFPSWVEAGEALKNRNLFCNFADQVKRTEVDYITWIDIDELNEHDYLRWFRDNRGVYAEKFNTLYEQLSEYSDKLKEQVEHFDQVPDSK